MNLFEINLIAEPFECDFFQMDYVRMRATKTLPDVFPGAELNGSGSRDNENRTVQHVDMFGIETAFSDMVFHLFF